MTPTEQDNELRGKIFEYVEYFNEMGSPEPGQDGWYITFDNKMDELMKLITADRERVALGEWEIANEAVLKNAQVISDEQKKLEALALVDPKKHNDKIGSYMDRAFGFDLAFQPFAEARRKRIAELKAKMEEK